MFVRKKVCILLKEQFRKFGLCSIMINVFCVSWKGNRLENHLLERCVLWRGINCCGLKFAVCIMTVSKGVLNVYVG